MADMKFKANALSSDDIKHIATQINAELDIPWIPETLEHIWIEWGIRKILSVVPESIVELLADASNGLTPDEIAKYEIIITNSANQIIDIPMLPEVAEEALIFPIVRQLLQFAVVGSSLSLQAPQSS